MKKLLKLAGILGLCSLIAFNVPRLHRGYLINKVGSRVVKITNQDGNHGGTGFYVKAPSNNTVILTNAHVCGVAKDGIVYVQDESMDRAIPKKVLEQSGVTDLCVIEGDNSKSGLTLGSKPQMQERIYIIGHPRLLPNTLSEGDIITQMEIEVLDHVIEDSKDKCDLPKNTRKKVRMWIFEFEACLVHLQAYATNAIVQPGNSGSPVVNKYGNLVGVLFAGDSANWGYTVIYEDIINFLQPY